jgi:uncharacterized membrane protein
VTPAGRADVYAAVARSPQPAAPKFAAVGTSSSGATLPKTATDAELRLWFGLALCCASLLLIVIRRRWLHVARCLPR